VAVARVAVVKVLTAVATVVQMRPAATQLQILEAAVAVAEFQEPLTLIM
jgi:hypothetical protein